MFAVLPGSTSVCNEVIYALSDGGSFKIQRTSQGFQTTYCKTTEKTCRLSIKSFQEIADCLNLLKKYQQEQTK